MQSKPSKTRTSFYRRIYVAWLIQQGINSVPKLIEATGMPRRTAQDTLAAIHELAIELKNSGGIYSVINWGAVDQKWVENNIDHLKTVLEYP
ncbi:MAG TPA: helix-turn-helix domain-containing protein [Cellvibrio sp.]|nr:helix-turn-helix domain-containing protein [Cellvibrio sp.]